MGCTNPNCSKTNVIIAKHGAVFIHFINVPVVIVSKTDHNGGDIFSATSTTSQPP